MVVSAFCFNLKFISIVNHATAIYFDDNLDQKEKFEAEFTEIKILIFQCESQQRKKTMRCVRAHYDQNKYSNWHLSNLHESNTHFIGYTRTIYSESAQRSTKARAIIDNRRSWSNRMIHVTEYENIS